MLRRTSRPMNLDDMVLSLSLPSPVVLPHELRPPRPQGLDAAGPTPIRAQPMDEGFRAREPSGWDTFGNTFSSSRDVGATFLLVVAHLTSSCHTVFRTDRLEGIVDERIRTSHPRNTQRRELGTQHTERRVEPKTTAFGGKSNEV